MRSGHGADCSSTGFKSRSSRQLSNVTSLYRCVDLDADCWRTLDPLRVLAEGCTVNIPDWRADPGYTFSAVQEISGLIGARRPAHARRIARWRHELVANASVAVQRQTNRTRHHVRNQAVIAIENARLLAELRESLQQQSRAADLTSVSSTDCKSNVERLITLSTSAVAVCC